MKINATEKASLSEPLIKEFDSGTRSGVKKIILHGNVQVNGKTIVRPDFRVDPGDVVEYRKFKAPEATADCPFPVLYEDDDLIMVVKPAGILTYGEKGSKGTSLYRELTEFLRNRSKSGERIYVVHRLDREVSGILMFAKSEKVQEQIKEHWKETVKRYYALVEGRPSAEAGILTNWLVEGKDQKMFIVRNEQANAKLAITHFKTMKKLPGYTLLEIELGSGRKHQIRAQLSEFGCPVVGDYKYGAHDKVKRRIRLHAFYFQFNHPVTKESLEFKTPMPRGFLTLAEKDERY